MQVVSPRVNLTRTHPSLFITHFHSTLRIKLQRFFSIKSMSIVCRTSSSLTHTSALYKSFLKSFVIPFSTTTTGKVSNKPSICTADELHYVAIPSSHWKLALWRYTPSSQAPRRNHPLILLSGIGTNAVGYDLSPESSFARYMSRKGFDTWILEVRGTGLSIHEQDSDRIEQSAGKRSQEMEAVSVPNKGGFIKSVLRKRFSEIYAVLLKFCTEVAKGIGSKTGLKLVFEWVSWFYEEALKILFKLKAKLLRLVETDYDSAVGSKIASLTKRLIRIINDSRQAVTSKYLNLHHRAFFTLDSFQKQIELMAKYDWDFDHYLEEDVPVAFEYVRAQTQPRDGKVLAIGHSMGGILLYAMLSKYGSEGKESGLAAVVTLASSLDYSNSQSTLKLLLPFADPAQTLNVPVIPLGAILAATYPLSSRTPYVMSWLYNFISAENMMHPELLKRLILNSFCAIPTKLLLQLTTAFRGGISNREGSFRYKDHLHKSNVPVLALAGNSDRICPPEAVLETVKLLPKHLITYKVFGEDGGPHYAHYDLIGGQKAPDEVYPCMVDFITSHDQNYYS